jgi:hypothetical protein
VGDPVRGLGAWRPRGDQFLTATYWTSGSSNACESGVAIKRNFGSRHSLMAAWGDPHREYERWTPCTRITRSRSRLRLAAYWPFSGSWLSPPQSVWWAGSEQRRVNSAVPSHHHYVTELQRIVGNGQHVTAEVWQYEQSGPLQDQAAG